MPPNEAQPLIVESWGEKRKTMKNFTIDVLRIESINLVMSQPDKGITRIKFYKGNKDNADIILTVGVDDKGNAIGNYFVTSFTDRVGPCPETCD